jgi:hypothetical protein
MKKAIIFLSLAVLAKAYCNDAQDSIALATFGKDLIKSILNQDSAWVSSHSFSYIRCIPCSSIPPDSNSEYLSPSAFVQKEESFFSTAKVQNEFNNSRYLCKKIKLNWKKWKYPKSNSIPNDKDKSYELYYNYEGQTEHESRTHVFQVFITQKGILLFGYETVP